MSDPINNGGPAFPQDEPDLHNGHYEGRYEIHRHHFGMSLRDWFAGQALAGYFANHHTPHKNAAGAADYIWETADAMIAERSKGEAQ